MNRVFLQVGYKAPTLLPLDVVIERGFMVSDNFEQPEFGGVDNL